MKKEIHDFYKILSKHQPIFDDVDGCTEGMVTCASVECGFEVDEGEWYDWIEGFAEHQSEVLAEIMENNHN